MDVTDSCLSAQPVISLILGGGRDFGLDTVAY